MPVMIALRVRKVMSRQLSIVISKFFYAKGGWVSGY